MSDSLPGTGAAAGGSSQRVPHANSAASASVSNPYVRVKAGNFSRLLYTNPVCLLTTSAPQQSNSDAAPVSTAASPPADAPAAIIPPTAASTPSASSSSSSCRRVPHRNVMTISWLTATSNHGEFVCSMHAGRFSAQVLAQQQRQQARGNSDALGTDGATAPPAFVGCRFVLNVPIAGMESLVRAVGGCSGGEEEEGAAPTALTKDKFERLGIKPCRPGGKPMQRDVTATAPAAAAAAAAAAGGPHAPRHASASSTLPVANGMDESAADADDASGDLLAIAGCAAHLVCRVVSACPAVEAPSPRVQAHNVLFCKVERAYVHRDYWINGNNFVAARPGVPPYLSFLGSGKFAHVTLAPNQGVGVEAVAIVAQTRTSEQSEEHEATHTAEKHTENAASDEKKPAEACAADTPATDTITPVAAAAP